MLMEHSTESYSVHVVPIQKPNDGSALAGRVDPLRIYVYTGLDVSDDPSSDYAKLTEWYAHQSPAYRSLG